MPTAYFNFDLSDAELLLQAVQSTFAFTRRLVSKRTAAQSPNTTIDITSLSAGVVALYISTDVPINVTINGAAAPIAVSSFLFMVVSSLATLVLAAVGATAANVEVVVWGG